MNDTARKIEYVPRAAEAVWTGPSDFRDVTLYGFVVKADRALLDEALNRYIDRPSQELGRRISVDTSFDRALFIFVESERVQPPVDPNGRAGSAGSHCEELFAIVLFGSRTDPDPAPVIYAPYVYASMSPGWRVEREIFGYPQQMASIEITPRNEPDHRLPLRLELKANAIKKFEPDAIADSRLILEIKRKPGATPDRKVSATALAQAIADAIAPPGAIPEDQGHAAARQPEPGPRGRRRWRRRHWRPQVSPARFGLTAADQAFVRRCPRESPDEEAERNESAPPVTPADSGDPVANRGSLEEMLRSGGVRMLFLKQFRDVVHADRACYQAIVEAAISGIGFNGGLISRDYRLTLNDLDSAPISRELGVPRNPSDVVLAFRAKFKEAKIGTGATRGTVISNPYWNPAMESSDPDEPSRLPKYVERGAEAVWRQPSLLFGMRIYGFGVKVSFEQQMATLNRYVNDIARKDSDVAYGRSPFRLVPCSGVETVMLMFIDYRQVTSGTDDDRRLGGVSYREFLAMQLALSDDEDFPELDWFIPFIYLDKDSPRLGGREIFGYPKQLGTIPKFSPFVPGGAAKRLELQGTVLPDAFARVADPSHSIVTIEGTTVPQTERLYTGAVDMIQDLLRVGAPSVQAGTRPGCLLPCHVAAGGGVDPGSLGAGVDIVNALVSGGLGHVFLKQFRDCEHPDRPCYQAVCKLDTAPGRFRGGARVSAGSYRIRINELESERLIEYLGSAAGDWQAGVTPDLAFWMDLDAELTAGRVIANPFEREFVPDRSANRDEQRNRRRIRRSREPAV